jgi:oxysterol-binding protein-related protein 9/10/11
LEGEVVFLDRCEICKFPISPCLATFILEYSTDGKQDQLITLIDVAPLSVAPKILPPSAQQLPNESLRFWSGVTDAITARQFSRATNLKQELEEGQRRKAKEREESGVEWQPRFFIGAVTPLGRPELTDEGKDLLKGLQEGRWDLKESKVLGA